MNTKIIQAVVLTARTAFYLSVHEYSWDGGMLGGVVLKALPTVEAALHTSDDADVLIDRAGEFLAEVIRGQASMKDFKAVLRRTP